MLIPLLIIVVICIDLGRVAYYNISLRNAVRAGAGYAVMNDSSTSGWLANVQSTARNEMTNQTGYNASQMTFLNTTPTVAVDTDPNAQHLTYVTLTAQYPFKPHYYSLLGIGSTINLQATVKMPLLRN